MTTGSCQVRGFLKSILIGCERIKMRKIRSLFILFGYRRYGADFKTKAGLFLLSCIQLLLLPFYYLNRHWHSVLFTGIASLFLKDARIIIGGKLFTIGSASDF